MIHFMGKCKYVFTKLKDRYKWNKCYFSVEEKNVVLGRNHRVSYIGLVDVKVEERTIRYVHVYRKLFIDAVEYTRSRFPMTITTRRGTRIKIYYFYNRLFKVVVSKCGLVVTYTHWCLVTCIDASLGNKVEGICGNCNGNRRDDLIPKGGTRPTSPLKFAWSWGVPDNSGIQKHKHCKAKPVDGSCVGIWRRKAVDNKHCGFIGSKHGPFKTCIASGLVNWMRYRRNCVFDVCFFSKQPTANVDVPRVVCSNVGAFAEACVLRGFHPTAWRSRRFCPRKCEPNAVYKLWMYPLCEPSCFRQKIPRSCKRGHRVHDCCQCKNGYFRLGNKCVRRSSCGCDLPDGQHINVGQRLVIAGCRAMYWCKAPGVLRRLRYRRCHKYASCRVVRGRYTCVCRRGFRGNGFVCTRIPQCRIDQKFKGGKCVPRCHRPWIFDFRLRRCVRRQCCCRGSGDPHYLLFDKRMIHFMGKCKYVFTKLKDRYKMKKCYFSVEEKNVVLGRNHRVSYIGMVDVKVEERTIRYVHLSRKVFIDKVEYTRSGFPMTIRTASGTQIKIYYRSGYFKVVASQCGLVVTYTHWCLVTCIDASLGTKVEGICGNCNGDRRDDLIPKGKNRLASPLTFASSWAVDDDSGIQKHQHCKTTPVDGSCVGSWKRKAYDNKHCGFIKWKFGPFKACIASGLVSWQTHLLNCVFDVCYYAKKRTWRIDVPRVVCSNLGAFAEACILRGFHPTSWRTLRFCPIRCERNAVFKRWMYPRCEPSCCVKRPPRDCWKGPRVFDACQCRRGYFRLGNRCVHPRKCGCELGDGQHIDVGQSVVTCGCKARYLCVAPGRLRRVHYRGCHKYAYCQVVRGRYTCVCRRGYMGNGFHCRRRPRLRCYDYVGPCCPWRNGRLVSCPRCYTSCYIFVIPRYGGNFVRRECRRPNYCKVFWRKFGRHAPCYECTSSGCNAGHHHLCCKKLRRRIP